MIPYNIFIIFVTVFIFMVSFKNLLLILVKCSERDYTAAIASMISMFVGVAVAILFIVL